MDNILRQTCGFFAMMLGTLTDPIALLGYIISGLLIRNLGWALAASIGWNIVPRTIIRTIESHVEGVEVAPRDSEVVAASFVGAILVTGIVYFFARNHRKKIQMEPASGKVEVKSDVTTNISDKPLISEVANLTPEQLDVELASPKHNDIGRHIVLQEKTRRAIADAARPNWMMRASLILALVAAIFAGISALPEIHRWFHGGFATTPSAATVAPDYGPLPTDVCKQALQNYFGPNFELKLTEPKKVIVDDPDHPDQKIYGWRFEASGNFRPPSKSNFPMAMQIIARGDSIILEGPIGGPFQRWGAGADK